MKEKPDLPNYKDLWFRGIACLLAAHYIVMMGWPGQTTFKAFMDPTYYPTLLINYIIALIVGMAVKKVTIALDRKHEWYKDIWRRAMLQFAFGVLAVSILSFLLVWAYFKSFGQDIVESGYLDYELPFSIALITILNFYYVAYYFYMYPRTKLASDKMEMVPVLTQPESNHENPIPQIPESAYTKVDVDQETKTFAFSIMTPENLGLIGNRKEGKEIVVIDTPKRSIPIKVEDVIMFFIFDKTVFVWNKDVKSFNDCHPIKLSLSDLEKLLDGQAFFRINRRCIINLSAIGAFEPANYQTIYITLKKEYGKLENIDSKNWTKMVTVSEDRATDFKRWINR